MRVFLYDQSFEGLLTCVFEAYAQHCFPDQLIAEGEVLPMFVDEQMTIVTDRQKAERVWKGLEKHLSPSAMTLLTNVWLSELPEVANMLFRYIRKTFDAGKSIETNFADPDVLALSQIFKKVRYERLHLMQFIRFQKTVDGTYFAAIEPQFNTLPLAITHFQDRFNDQPWLIYDTKRRYGYYYDLKTVELVTFEDQQMEHLVTGKLQESMIDKDEKLFQDLWRTYFKAIAIKERWNPRKHRKDLPFRYWKYLTEKQ